MFLEQSTLFSSAKKTIDIDESKRDDILPQKSINNTVIKNQTLSYALKKKNDPVPEIHLKNFNGMSEINEAIKFAKSRNLHVLQVNDKNGKYNLLKSCNIISEKTLDKILLNKSLMNANSSRSIKFSKPLGNKKDFLYASSSFKPSKKLNITKINVTLK
jgi:hypothetical protein